MAAVKPTKDPFLNAQYIRVAFKISYDGRNYNGFETCEDKKQEHTVAIEDKLFDALEKVTMIRDRKTIEKECGYSKAGRTDAGVSATGNVISLKVRKLADDIQRHCVILNRSLPDDIRALDCVEVPEEWSARFDCVSREYTYFFMRRNYNVVEMNKACELLIGKHDFRNICKMNVVQTDSFVRDVIHAAIYPADHLIFGEGGWDIQSGMKMENMDRPKNIAQLTEKGSPYDMFYLRIRGSAFLWHQVSSLDDARLGAS